DQECLAEQSALVEVLDQRGEGVVEHRPQGIERREGREGGPSVDVPGEPSAEIVEHVDGHETNAAFDQSAREQTALAEPVHPITMPDAVRLRTDVESGAGLLGRENPVRLVEARIRQLHSGTLSLEAP